MACKSHHVDQTAFDCNKTQIWASKLSVPQPTFIYRSAWRIPPPASYTYFLTWLNNFKQKYIQKEYFRQWMRGLYIKKWPKRTPTEIWPTEGFKLLQIFLFVTTHTVHYWLRLLTETEDWKVQSVLEYTEFCLLGYEHIRIPTNGGRKERNTKGNARG
jgi:hypothetical protein